jgi:protein-S-isoprenylcysteine O-methyltransferase Ste14
VKRYQELLYGLHPYLLSSIAGILTMAQVVLAFFFCRPQSVVLVRIGQVFLGMSAFFGVWPILVFRRKGGVAKGQSYVRTTLLVDSGLYAIVRHPQNGTAWLLINLGIASIAQHWSSWALGLASMVLAYVDHFKADQRCIEKFGEAYREYMQRVPRVNFVLGLVRWAWHKAKAALATDEGGLG